MPEQNAPPSPWLTPTEAAAYLKVSRRTLDNLLRDHKIRPHYRAGERSPRYHTEELDAWMLGESGR